MKQQHEAATIEAQKPGRTSAKKQAPPHSVEEFFAKSRGISGQVDSRHAGRFQR